MSGSNEKKSLKINWLVVFIPKIAYKYTYNGKNYSSYNYCFLDDGDTPKTAQKIISEFSVGQKSHCYINLKNPKQSIINKNMRFCITFLIGCIVGLVFGLIRIFVILYGIKINATPKELKYKATES